MASKGVRSVGVRELARNASRIVRRVRETGKETAVTVRGEVVAVLAPVAPAARRPSRSTFVTLDRLAREIGRAWPKSVSAAAAVREQRR